MKQRKVTDYQDGSEWQIWEKRMYLLYPAPPKMEFDEYIERYRDTGDGRYFLYFLHAYEPALNRRALRYCSNYWVMPLFPDVKQTIVTALFEYATSYDHGVGVPFLAYTQLMVRDAVREFVRRNGGVHSVANASHFRRLAKVNALYYAGLDLGLTSRQCIVAIANKLNTTTGKVCSLIEEGLTFRDFKSLAIRSTDAADEENKEQYERYDRGDKTADPGEVVPDVLFMDEVMDAIDTLPYKQQQILFRFCGIRCMACGRVGNRETYAALANEFELYSESAVERARNDAIQKVRKFIQIEKPL